MTATGQVGARAQQSLGCSAPAPTCVLSSLQHSDGTFCVKPLKQKQVVSVRVSPRAVAATALHTPGGEGGEGLSGSSKPLCGQQPAPALLLPPREPGDHWQFQLHRCKEKPRMLG